MVTIFADDIFIFINEKFCISIRISLKFIHKGPTNNVPALVQIKAWHRLDIFMNEKLWILIQISLNSVLKGPIDNKSVVVQAVAWES